MPHQSIFRTQDLIVKMIQEGILSIFDADLILEDWARKHRFKLKINSFRDILYVAKI